MAKASTTRPAPPTKASPDQWVQRLGVLLNTLDAMDPDERAAALSYAKSRFRMEWPSDSYT